MVRDGKVFGAFPGEKTTVRSFVGEIVEESCIVTILYLHTDYLYRKRIYVRVLTVDSAKQFESYIFRKVCADAVV